MLALKSKKDAEVILYQKYKLEHPRETSEVMKETEERKIKVDRIPKIIRAISRINKKNVIAMGAVASIVFLTVLLAPTLKRSIEENISRDIKQNVTPDQGEITEIKEELETVKGIAVDAKKDVSAVTGVLNSKKEIKVEDGKNGEPGLPGKQGFEGLPGAEGLPGKDGLPGKNGLVGMTGNSGANGRDGIAGESGKNGVDGESGKDGVDGASGKNGIDGESGKNGMDGESGKDGIDGESGKNGVDGESGKDGIAGKDGLDGSNGKSAYAAAVEAGYTGTEADYAAFMASTPGKIIGFESDLGTLNSNLEASVGTINESINRTIDNIGKTNARVEECFTSVSSGKSLLASTLTGFSFPTDASATFATIDTNVKNLADARYNNGFIDGQKNAMDNLEVTYVKHNHTGNATAGGGCYTNANVHNHTGGSSSGGGCYLTPQYRDDPMYGTCPTTWLSFLSYRHDGYSRCSYICDRCKYVFDNNDSGDGIYKGISRPHQSKTPTSYNKVLTGYGLSCGKSDGQNLGYSEACGYTEGQIISATITY